MDAWVFGFEAIMEERSGREDFGIGGGVLLMTDDGSGPGGGRRV